MTILDTGGLTALAGQADRIAQVISRGQWPPVVPAGILVEALTGDHRRDIHVNRLLRTCDIRPVTELITRHSAALRTLAGRSGISAIDAIVAATADHAGGGIVLTSDPDDLRALAENTLHRLHIQAV